MRNDLTVIKSKAHEKLDINNDYILPDYINDVRRLVRCDAKVILHNTYRSDNIFTFEGEVIYAILVICENDTLKNMIYSEDFSVNGSYDELQGVCVHDCRLENVSARLISPRKLNCKSRVSIITKQNVEENISPTFCGEQMPEAEYTVELQNEQCRCMSIDESKVSNQHASRDIEISSDKEEIANIVYCNIDTCINEQKLVEGKLYLRGEGKADILYETVNSNYVKLSNRFPFNEIIDDEFEADGYICDVTVCDIKATAGNNTFGEMRMIELDYTYDIKCRGYTEHTVDLVSDLYSTEYNTDCSYRDITYYRLNRIFSSSLSVNDAKPLEEITDEMISSVVDCNASVASLAVNCDRENRRVILTGDIKFDIVCKGERYHNISLIVPYKYEREYDGDSHDIYEEHIIKLLSGGAVIDKGRLIINSELYFNVMLAEPIKGKCIGEAEFSVGDITDTSPIIIYYPKSGDSLWDIAKKYKSTCADIKNINSMSGDSLEGMKVLLLPKKKPKSVFNTII